MTVFLSSSLISELKIVYFKQKLFPSDKKLLINNSEKMPLSIALYSLTGSEILDWGQMMAASVIVILPSVVFFMIIQNKIAGGLSDGSVK